MAKQKVLVTGGTGYIGSHTVVELIENGYEVEILDNLYNSKIGVLDIIEKLTGVRPKFYEVDLRDTEGLARVFAKNHYDGAVSYTHLTLPTT